MGFFTCTTYSEEAKSHPNNIFILADDLEDVDESKDLKKENPEKAKEIRSMLDNWLNELEQN